MVTLVTIVFTSRSASFHHITARVMEGLRHFHITLYPAVPLSLPITQKFHL